LQSNKIFAHQKNAYTTNLPSGYHPSLQLPKEHLFPAFSTLKDCINIATLMLSNIEVKKIFFQAKNINIFLVLKK